ncbi:MAG: aspartate aminotransferase family protein [Balneolaceae bacterium]
MRSAFYRHVAQTSDSPMGLEIERADGCTLYTVDGQAYTDLISGIAVSSLGHSHPDVVNAVKAQADRYMHVMVYGEFIQQPQVDFAELLAAQLPDMLSRIYFVNSGTEAVEGALKLAKKHTGRSRLVSFRNSYHGDTHGALSVTGRDIYRDPYLPLLPEVHFLDYNDQSRLDLIDGDTAGVILEPVQGEGGVIPADPGWLNAVREQCSRTGALLIFDEIQTGFFRTGELFAFEHYGVTPDILCMAKAMGGGLPLGGFAASPDILRAFMHDPPLNHVTTFGGHPVSCAAALASLKVLLNGNFKGKAARIEAIARDALQGKGIVDLRGKGAMLGLELENARLTRHVVSHCFDKKLILGWTLHSDTLVRIAPPLIIDENLFRRSLQIILEALETGG